MEVGDSGKVHSGASWFGNGVLNRNTRRRQRTRQDSRGAPGLGTVGQSGVFG